MRYLLDTNVISELIARQPNAQVVAWIDSLDPTTVYLSVITIGEIRKGIEKLEPSKRKDVLLDWLNTDLLIRFHEHLAEITTEVMLRWGEMTGQLERQGRPVGVVDSLIAAIALAGEFVLVTRNQRDFEGTGVTLLNPWSH
ncbi:MAG TPA: type II toxin-antitoxin system VapC family toxin [Anaerolineae bacterium]